MHHLRVRYDGKCCFHSKSVPTSLTQTGSVPLTSYTNTFLHSNEQNSVSQPSIPQGTGPPCDPLTQPYMQQSQPPEELFSVANCMPNNFGESSVLERIVVSDPHAYKNELNISHLPSGHVASTFSSVGVSGPSLATFTVPPIQIHSNENVAALNKQTLIEGAAVSSPQTVRRIINATSALNAFHQVTPHIVSAALSSNSAPNGHPQILNVSLPYSDVSVSSPSKLYFSQSGS